MTAFEHITVLLNETVNLLTGETHSPCIPAGRQLWADCTLGGAGHTLLLLERLAKHLSDSENQTDHHEILCCDQDPTALNIAHQRIQQWFLKNEHLKDQITVTPLALNFRHLPDWIHTHRKEQRIAGLMADLGVSSPQIDTAERGFSFLREGPLDMRMNTDSTTTAKDLLNSLEPEQLKRIFDEYGEEPRARALARAIVEDRNKGLLPLSNTVEFADYVGRVLGYHQSRVHPATRVFQALRIAVNEELAAVEDLLGQLPQIMAAGGCAGIISFHSLEDRLVKRFFRAWELGEFTPEAKRENEKRQWREAQMGIYAATNSSHKSFGREEPRGGVQAGEEELKRNPRARSARLRGFRFSN